jgi:hypothetical protein
MLSRNIPGVGSGRSAKDMVVVELQKFCLQQPADGPN